MTSFSDFTLRSINSIVIVLYYSISMCEKVVTLLIMFFLIDQRSCDRAFFNVTVSPDSDVITFVLVFIEKAILKESSLFVKEAST